MNQRLIKTILLGSLFALGMALGGCHSAPETNIDKIDNLKKQVQTDAKTLSNLETKDFVSLGDRPACGQKPGTARGDLRRPYGRLRHVRSLRRQRSSRGGGESGPPRYGGRLRGMV